MKYEYEPQGDALFSQVIRGEGSFDERAEALRKIAREIVQGMRLASRYLKDGRSADIDDWDECYQAAHAISDAGLFCLLLDDLLAGTGESGLRLRLMGAKPKGAPPDFRKRRVSAEKAHRAARIVERLVRSGMQQEQAIWTVLAKTGFDGSPRFGTTRDGIFAALRDRRKWRERLGEVTERELMSWIIS